MDWNNLQIWQELHGVVSTNHKSINGNENVLSVIEHHIDSITNPSSKSVNKHRNSRVDNILKCVTPYTKAIKPSGTQLILMTQLHVCKSQKRIDELTQAINTNISQLGKSLNEMVLFTENIPHDQALKLLGHEDKPDHVTIIPVKCRMTYKDYMMFVHENIQDNILVLITNSDCSFDNTLNILKHLNYTTPQSQSICYTITRNENGKPCTDPQAHKWSIEQYENDQLNVSNMVHLEPWSTDAWCFNSNMLNSDQLDIDMYNVQLGTNACEIVFKTNLYKSGIKLHNIGYGGYITCKHHHDSNFREQSNWSYTLPELVSDFYPTDNHPRDINNSIKGCHRIRTSGNWMDADTYEHQYTDYVVTNLEPHLTSCHTSRILVMLVTTLKEFNKGFVENTLNHYIQNNNSVMSFDILISMDNTDQSIREFVKQLNKRMSGEGKIMLHDVMISDLDNVYYRQWKDSKSSIPLNVPRLGYSTGPNVLFFDSMKHVSTLPYDNVLLLETDTATTTSDWFDICYNYTYSHDFLIAGSKYKGKFAQPDTECWHADYLNGVGLYSNCKKLHDILEGTELLLQQLMSGEYFDCFMNYDVAIGYYMDVTKHPDRVMYMDTDLFTNVSLDDEDAPESIMLKHPHTCIIHHKKFQISI